MYQRALIIGINGMDGSLLADLLLSKQYEVHGMVRRSSSAPANLWRIANCLDRVTLHEGDLLDPASLHRIIAEVRPAEIYQEADQDHVGFSYATPAYSTQVTLGGVVNVLEAVRAIDPSIRVFQPCSATMFGAALAPQDERTPLAPQSPYAVMKAAAFLYCQHMRREHGLWVATAIMCNHDSDRRRGDYLLHKIARKAAELARDPDGTHQPLMVESLDMQVDIGWAPEYVEACWRIVQQDQPDDYVLASGDPWSIRAIIQTAFVRAGVAHLFDAVVCEDASTARPGPRPRLIGNAAKARKVLGFAPTKDAADVVEMLVDHYRGTVVVGQEAAPEVAGVSA